MHHGIFEGQKAKDQPVRILILGESHPQTSLTNRHKSYQYRVHLSHTGLSSNPSMAYRNWDGRSFGIKEIDQAPRCCFS